MFGYFFYRFWSLDDLNTITKRFIKRSTSLAVLKNFVLKKSGVIYLMQSIKLKDLKGMTDEIYQKLLENGINSVVRLAAIRLSLRNYFDIPEKLSDKLRKQAQKIIDSHSFSKFEINEKVFGEYKEKTQTLKKPHFFSSGSKKLDTALVNGFSTQMIYEIHGLRNVGKTSLFHQLICNTFMSHEDGVSKSSVIYIDTGRNFSEDRIIKMSRRYEIDHTEVINNVKLILISSIEELNSFLKYDLSSTIGDTDTNLIFLDSITTTFNLKNIHLFIENDIYNKIIDRLVEVAREHNATIFLCNETDHFITIPRLYKLIDEVTRIEMRFDEFDSNKRLFLVGERNDIIRKSCSVYLLGAGFIQDEIRS